MVEKFSLDDLFMRIMPGGIFLGIIILIYYSTGNVKYVKELDFLYLFMFFTISYVIGEIIQTIAHMLDRFITPFYKFYMPSDIFLYKNNPVVEDKIRVEDIIKECGLTEEEEVIINSIDYKNLSWFKDRKAMNEAKKISNRCFCKMYHNVYDSVQIFNRGYLFTRGMTCMFFIVSILLLINNNFKLLLLSMIIFCLFLWRLRGTARTLVFKVVCGNLYKK